eukprot:Lankesteria_metandrocarpae@DN1670_c0_g1_i4.p1
MVLICKHPISVGVFQKCPFLPFSCATDDPHYTVPWVLQEVWLDSTKTPPWNTDRLLEMFNTPSHRCSSVHLLKVNGEPASADISDTAVTLLDLRISLANLGVTQGGQLLMFRTLRK